MKQLDYNHQSSYHVQILHNDFHWELSTIGFCLHCALNTKNISQLRCQRILTNTSFITRNTILFLWQQYNGIILPRVDLLLRIADVELPLHCILPRSARVVGRRPFLEIHRALKCIRCTKACIGTKCYESFSNYSEFGNGSRVCLEFGFCNETRSILLGSSYECRYCVFTVKQKDREGYKWWTVDHL